MGVLRSALVLAEACRPCSYSLHALTAPILAPTSPLSLPRLPACAAEASTAGTACLTTTEGGGAAGSTRSSTATTAIPAAFTPPAPALSAWTLWRSGCPPASKQRGFNRRSVKSSRCSSLLARRFTDLRLEAGGPVAGGGRVGRRRQPCHAPCRRQRPGPPPPASLPASHPNRSIHLEHPCMSWRARPPGQPGRAPT